MKKIHQFLYNIPELIKLLIITIPLCMSYFYTLELASYEHIPFYSFLFFIVAVVIGMMIRKPKE